MALREFNVLSDEELNRVLKENKVLNGWIVNDYKIMANYDGLEINNEDNGDEVLEHFKNILFVFVGKCCVDEYFKVRSKDGTAFNWGLLSIIQLI